MRRLSPLLFFLIAGLSNVCGQTPVLPTMPQRTVNLTLPVQGSSSCPTLTTGSNCIRKVPAGDAQSLQNAINASTCGDTIVLEADSTYSGNFTIPATSCTSGSGWIEIVSSALVALPPPGTRVGPSNTSKMATISTPNGAPALAFHPGSNHWRIIGCEITTSYKSENTLYWLVGMGLEADNSTWVLSVSKLPSFVILDRIYIYGSTTTPIQHGIYANTQAFGLVDSYCDQIVDSWADSQCLSVVNGTGPFLIQNNFLQASGENVMFGGGDPAIVDLVPSDITIIGNLFQKDVAWRGIVRDVKNLLELKNAQRLLIDGNVFQYDWAAGQQWAILFRSISGGKAPWSVVQDVTFTHNLLQHIPSGIETAAADATTAPVQPTARILVRNNVLTDVSSTNWGPSQGTAFFSASNATYSTHDIVFDHNTEFSDGKALLLGDSGRVDNFQFTNNLLNSASFGVFGSGVSAGTAVFTAYASHWVYGQNVFVNSKGGPTGTYPSGTLWSTLEGVKFVSASGKAPAYVGNFRLLVTSPFHSAGTDDRDIGVWDWTCLHSDAAAALTGNFVPGPDGCALLATQSVEPPKAAHADGSYSK